MARERTKRDGKRKVGGKKGQSAATAAPARKAKAEAASRPDERRAPTHEQIAERAYEIWCAEGRPAGRDRECWLAAERSLIVEIKPNAAVRASAG